MHSLVLDLCSKGQGYDMTLKLVECLYYSKVYTVARGFDIIDDEECDGQAAKYFVINFQSSK